MLTPLLTIDRDAIKEKYPAQPFLIQHRFTGHPFLRQRRIGCRTATMFPCRSVLCSVPFRSRRSAAKGVLNSVKNLAVETAGRLRKLVGQKA